MKNIFTIIILAFAINFAQANDTLTVVFYFEAQSSTLTQTQEDSISSILEYATPVSIVGFANALPNMTTHQANIDLANDRAMSVATIVNLIPTGYQVIKSNSASDRRVEITFVIETKMPTSNELFIDIYGNEVSLSDISNPTNGDDSAQASSITNTSIINDNTNNISPLCMPRMIACEFKITNETRAAFNTMSAVSNPDNSCGCSIAGGSLQDTWGLYKSYQDSATMYVHIDNGLRDLYTFKAMEVRKCWKTMFNAYKYQTKMKSRDPSFDIRQHRLEQEVSAKAKVTTKRSNRSKYKSHTSVRLRRPVRLNNTVWIRLFPFSAC